MNYATDNFAKDQQIKSPSSSGTSQASQKTCPLSLTPGLQSQATVVGVVSPMLHKVDSISGMIMPTGIN